MKQMDKATAPASKMLKRQARFSITKTRAALKTVAENAKKAPRLFPEGSIGSNSYALTVIWERKPEFEGLFTKLEEVTQAARAAIKDEKSFRAEFPKVTGTCDSCHNRFRKDE